MPANSKILIINRALIKLGADRIGSLTEGSKASEIANTIYDELRRETLEAHPWNFATKQVTLAQLSDAPSWEYAYGYAKPADCVRVIKTDLTDEEEWREIGPNLVTDSSRLGIEYIYDVEDVSLFSKHFEETFVCRLAMDFAYAMTGKADLVSEAKKQYERALAMGRSFDAQTGRHSKVKANRWINARK